MSEIYIRIDSAEMKVNIPASDAKRIFCQTAKQIIKAKGESQEKGEPEVNSTPAPEERKKEGKPFVVPHPNRPEAPDRVLHRDPRQRGRISFLGSGDDDHAGPMLIRCKHCGKDKIFISKYHLDYFICRECGGKTNLPKEQKRVMFSCPSCGTEYRVHTNIEDIEINAVCENCGCKSHVNYHPETGDYR